MTQELMKEPTAARGAAWLRPAVAVAAIGWGANQFSPLIVFYQQHGVSTTATGVMFGLYAVGLIPALLVGGRWSDQAGRKRVVVVALLFSLAATVLLILGKEVLFLLFVGRFVAGISSGLAFGTGAAWIREDSPGGHRGARRATIAMTTGFGLGPLVAGLLGQWTPDPQVWPYLPNLVLCVVALWLLAGADSRRPLTSPSAEQVATAARSEVNRHLLRVSLLFAPWVFGTAAIALAYLPGLVAKGSNPLAFAAIATAIPAFVGVLVQPVIARGDRLATALLMPAMGVTVVALGIAVWAAAASTVWAVIVAEIALGAAYGITQFAGLADIQQITPRTLLGYATSTYQALAYLGFAVPYLLSLAHVALGWSPALGLAAVTAIAVVATLGLLLNVRRTKVH
ncbi:MFS transporter [Amycolatopsis acidicola]|uniref:MFS transporter n=1 Tax=Amycolatopsis acidicola TaxID=2596893 RepID=A0A5N0UVN1_9PSEU|nr:MFS transporter [Amycolatopsis acidicola]KAA9155793.1 MFS transporter [Amycolatopsis acidicola]